MPKRIQPLVYRILSRLSQAQAEEPDPWFRDDLQIAHRIVAHAARGDAVLCTADVLASYEVLGLHPEKVWPAIEARRIALGPLCAVPKKPPQSVKLWSEKTKSVRAGNSHAQMQHGSPRTSIPSMATASIAALYPNSGAPSSAKKRGFTYDEMLTIVEFSGAPHSVRQGTLSALKARGPWPNGDGPVTGVICVSLIGMMFHGVCCRSTARWRARRACKLGYWRELRDANSWANCPKCGERRAVGTCGKCGYVGRAKHPDGSANFEEFSRPWMYEIDIEKFRSAPRCRELRHYEARTYAEFKELPRRAEHANVSEFPRKPAQPAAEPEHRNPQRAPQPSAANEPSRHITREVRAAIFNTYIALKKTGMSHEDTIAEVRRQFRDRFTDEDIDFAVKVRSAKEFGSTEPLQPAPTKAFRCNTCRDERVLARDNIGPGEKRLIPCPDCGANSS